jgi:hypothetical protein
MINISGFFQKFLNLEKDKNTKIILIIDVIKKETGLELSNQMLEIKGDSVRLNCNAVFRNEIFMHKSQIESALRVQKIFLNLV